MSKIRKKHSSSFKAKVALAALLGTETVSSLSTRYGVHGTQIGKWKKELEQNLPLIFDRNKNEKLRSAAHQAKIDELYRQIGKQKVELDWLKKKVDGLPP